MSIILQIRSNGQITLPASIRRQAKLSEGDALEIVVGDDGIIQLVPVVVVDRSQAYFWTDRWQDQEREVEEYLRSGRYTDFDDIKDLIAELDIDEQ